MKERSTLKRIKKLETQLKAHSQNPEMRAAIEIKIATIKNTGK